MNRLRYLLINTDGDLSDRAATGNPLTIVDREVGEPGHAPVRLPSWAELGAYVNDCGHVLTPPLPINVPGSCLLASLGAPPLPYAGPVVITGWDDCTAGIEIVSLGEAQVAYLANRYRNVLAAVRGENPADGVDPGWHQSIAAYANMVRAAKRPAPVVLTGAAAEAHLRGGWRPER
jgi:hypothetical protein